MAESTDRIKGKGTTLWRLKTGTAIADANGDGSFDRIGDVKEITPPEMTKEVNNDTYIDDDSGYHSKQSGMKDPGELGAVIAWKPGDEGQKTLVNDFENDVKTWYRIKYTNGTEDLLYGEVTKLGKALAESETVTRSIAIALSGQQTLAEHA